MIEALTEKEKFEKQEKEIELVGYEISKLLRSLWDAFKNQRTVLEIIIGNDGTWSLLSARQVLGDEEIAYRSALKSKGSSKRTLSLQDDPADYVG